MKWEQAISKGSIIVYNSQILSGVIILLDIYEIAASR